jgi:branched-chain amino acid transport system permease protein
VFGPLLIVLLIFMPQGLVGTWAQMRARRQTALAALESPPAPRINPRRAGGRHA